MAEHGGEYNLFTFQTFHKKNVSRPGRGLASRAGRDPGQPCQAEGEEGAGRPRRRRVGGQEQEGQGSHHHLLRDIFVKPGMFHQY